MTADLDRLRADATQLRAGMRAPAPEQARSLSYEERRNRCPTGHLWPTFSGPGRG